MNVPFRRIALTLATLLFAGSAAAQPCEDPKVLRFSIIPTQESVRELTLYKPVLDLLAKNTGKKIEFYMPTSYSSVVEALLGMNGNLHVSCSQTSGLDSKRQSSSGVLMKQDLSAYLASV